MAKKIIHEVSWVDTLSIKKLKIEAAQRGLAFELISAYGVLELQGWVHNNRDKAIDKSLLLQYDKFLRGIGDLDFGLLGFDMKPTDKPLEKLTQTYNEHDPAFVPRAGTKKELTQQLVQKGMPTKEIINEVFAAFGRTNPQSIKSWCSRFRKQLKIKALEEND